VQVLDGEEDRRVACGAREHRQQLLEQPAG
jgi:hypothetical protein